MLGYFEDEEATREAIVDGWFRTGDLGRFDDKGNLIITGRCKSVIVTPNGKNIFPEEIEDEINRKVAPNNRQEIESTGVNNKIPTNFIHLK